MGGYGSGRKYSGSKRDVKEDGLNIDGNILAEAIHGKGGAYEYVGKITWKRHDEPFASIGYSLIGHTFTLDYTRNGVPLKYPVTLTTTHQPKGGLRYWFICPLKGCGGRRSAKLYLPSGARYFGCRKCYNLTYESSNESHKFDGLYRDMARNAGTSFEAVKKMMNKRNWK